METVYIGFSIRVWTYAGNPDNDVHTAGGSYADIGEPFINTVSGEIFLCTNNISGSMTWTPYITGVLQSDWNESSSGAQDYIKNKPTIPAAQIQSDWNQTNTSSLDYIKNKPAAYSQSTASHSLNSIFQVSSTRWSFVTYSVDISCTSTLVGGQSGTVFLEISPSNTFASGIQEIGEFTNGNSVSLAIAITVVQVNTGCISAMIPPGYYARLRTANNTGTPTFTYKSGFEVLL